MISPIFRSATVALPWRRKGFTMHSSRPECSSRHSDSSFRIAASSGAYRSLLMSYSLLCGFVQIITAKRDHMWRSGEPWTRDNDVVRRHGVFVADRALDRRRVPDGGLTDDLGCECTLPKCTPIELRFASRIA